MNETGETVREVCAEMREHSSGDVSETYYDRYAWEVLINRILAAHERELAAIVMNLDALEVAVEENCDKTTVEKIITSKRHSQNSTVAKDAEIARLKAALKPVMSVGFRIPRGHGKSGMIHFKDILELNRQDAVDSVREAQRIVGAWDDKNYFDKECRND